MNDAELARLKSSSINAAEPTGGIFRYPLRVECAGDAVHVDRRLRDLLFKTLERAEDGLSVNEWRSVLPAWFVEACSPLPASKNTSDVWSLDAWIHWFTDEERSWEWIGSTVVNQNRFDITLSVIEFPFAKGALEWAIMTAGGTNIQEVGPD